MKRILIVGSSGFIGSNLVDKLQKEGHFVYGTDIESPKHCEPGRFLQWDFTNWVGNRIEEDTFDEAYCLAACMGGMGYIGDEETHGYDIGVGSTKIVSNFIDLAQYMMIPKVFFSSSACVYNQDLQLSSNVVALKESDAIPANPDLLYGWQKLYAEKMFQTSGLDVRIARFHNIFGQWGTYDGGKEKAPAALCRKVAMAKDGDEIEVWGSGTQTRSFLFIDECLEGVDRLMKSDYKEPINIGSDELISINDLAKMIIEISGKKLKIKNIEGNVGVQGRNSDNTLIQEVLGWKPIQPLRNGIKKLYEWVNSQIGGHWILPQAINEYIDRHGRS
jgi:GDP-D-mannose 3',5'-epimerase